MRGSLSITAAPTGGLAQLAPYFMAERNKMVDLKDLPIFATRPKIDTSCRRANIADLQSDLLIRRFVPTGTANAVDIQRRRKFCVMCFSSREERVQMAFKPGRQYYQLIRGCPAVA